ncbi:glycosyltransferase [Spirosoma humi]
MVSVIIPTYNAASYLPSLLKSLREQTIDYELIIIDSGSTDDTIEILKGENVSIISINKSDFNHGKTRNLALNTAKSDIVVFMTQDALPASTDSIDKLVATLRSRKDIALAYGRQLPYPQTGVFGRLARLTNYPSESIIKTKDLIPILGIKTCSCSNSFAAYFKTDLLSVGGFPSNTILGEDVSVAARLILDNKAVAYSAEAAVFHSHDYTLIEEFKRYFDIGVFHEEQHAILSQFSKAESEGIKYVFQEWKYLSKNGYINLIPAQLLRTIFKYVGYRIGRGQRYMPVSLKRLFSMHSLFWK